mgnify:CR=1 FL=1
MIIIMGLGNPGRKFGMNRHNVGFMCVDYLSRLWGIRLYRRNLVVIGQGTVESEDVVLVKPRTFMNNSGVAVQYLISRFGVSKDDFLVIYDEMDLPLGRIRIRPEGSAAGHNGMKSIISVLDSQRCARIRIGIGRPDSSKDDIGYVLGSFTKQENDVVERSVARVAQAIGILLVDGIEDAMNQFNQESS